MAIVLLSIVWTAVVVGGGIGIGVLISRMLDKCIDAKAENLYKKLIEKNNIHQ